MLFMENNDLNYRNIAHHSIRLRRESTVVPCGPGGKLVDYVPFYFAPRSPMLYTIHRNNVEGYSEGQHPIVHLVSSTQAVKESRRDFVFTDGHATMELTEFFDELRHLDRIDWDVMGLRYWYDTDVYPDRKRKRQAEFLVYQFCPWELVFEIGVIDSTMQEQVRANLERTAHQPIVTVRPDWYY